MERWTKFVLLIFLVGINVAAIILCFRHYEQYGTVPLSYGVDRYRLEKLLLINYQLLFSSTLTTGTWTIACIINDILVRPEDRLFAALAEGLFRHATLLLLDLRIKMLNETSLSGRISIAFGDAIAVTLIAVHSYWHRKAKQT